MIRIPWIPIAALVWAAVPPLSAQQSERGRIHGYVREAETGEPIVLAEVSPVDGAIVVTDRDGYFATPPLPVGATALRIEAYGYAPLDTVVVAGGAPVTFTLVAVPIQLQGLQVRAREAADQQPGVRLIGRAQLRRIPPALESDLLRSLHALPGVSPASPVSSRPLVRGGAPDQNQFLLDGFPVIYPYHLAGAFSAFHIGAVQDVAFWPGSPPARYGGHLSSVIDIQLREGNRERMQGEAGVGLVTSSAALEGPVPGGAGMLALRRTYIDALARAGGGSVPYNFWDVTAKLHVDLTPSDRLSLVAFHGRDRLSPDRDGERDEEEPPAEEFAWNNGVFGLSWRHLFGGNAVFEQRVSRSVFGQRLDLGRTRIEGAFAGSEHDVDLRMARGDLTIPAVPGHVLTIGYEASRREYLHRTGYEVSLVGLDPDARERSATGSTEAVAAYVEDEIAIGRARLRLGLRGERFESYPSVQPRVALVFRPRETVALHGWWGHVRQYDHVLQDPDLELSSLYSIDIWLAAAEADVAPATAEHFGIGAEMGLPLGTTLRADAYAKRLRDLFTIPDAIDADRRVAIERLEPGSGRVTGFDLALHRAAPEGLTGWLGYSYLHARTTTDRETYPSARQPRHRLVSVLDWREGPWRFNGRIEAFEGLPYTPAVASFARRPFDFGYRRFSPTCEAIEIEYLYGPRNSARTPWSKRLDFGTRYAPDRDGRWNWEFGFGLYNALFDPPGMFRPRRPALFPPEGCDLPVDVEREPELVLPAVPFLTFHISF